MGSSTSDNTSKPVNLYHLEYAVFASFAGADNGNGYCIFMADSFEKASQIYDQFETVHNAGLTPLRHLQLQRGVIWQPQDNLQTDILRELGKDE